MAIAIGGSNAGPVTPAHVCVCQCVMDSGLVTNVIWRPDGSRPDKPERYIEPEHKLNLINLVGFEKLETGSVTFEIDPSNLWATTFPSTIQVLREAEAKYAGEKIYWYTGADSVMPQKKYGGKCEIEARWNEGETLMAEFNFIILPRGGYPHPSTFNLPPNFTILDCCTPEIASSTIWKLIAEGNDSWMDIYGGPDSPVALYIRTHKLCGYQGG